MKKPRTFNLRVALDFQGKRHTSNNGLSLLLQDIVKEVRDAIIKHPKGDRATCVHEYKRLDRYWNICQCGTLRPTENI